MDEVLTGNNVKTVDIPRRLITALLVLILATFAAVMIFVGISNFMELDIFTGIIYCLMGIVDVSLIVVGLKESGADRESA